MQLRHISLPLLIDAAGGDPWQVNGTLQSGDPGVVDELAQAFHSAGSCTADSGAAFTEARRRFQSAWGTDNTAWGTDNTAWGTDNTAWGTDNTAWGRENTAWGRENTEHPINGSLEVRRATATLLLQQTQLTSIGTDLENIAAALAEAQKSAARKIAALEIQLQDIDNHIGVYRCEQLDTSELEQIAVDDTAGIRRQLEKVRDDYAATLQASTAALLSDGYDPAPLCGYDGDGRPTRDQQDSRTAETYDAAQRADDKALVDGPGETTSETATAAARLRDYATLTDPAAGAEARHLAGERLEDYRMANFIGPLPADVVLGGNARSSAAARLTLQRQLESGSLHPDVPAMTPDQATRAVDDAESAARSLALSGFADRLRSSGVSPVGVQQAVAAVKRGVSPREFLDGVSSAAGATGAGLVKYGEALPTGRHWGDAPTYSKADAEALTRFGRELGRKAGALDFALTASDIVGGKISFQQGLAELGGRSAGGAGAASVTAGFLALMAAPEVVIPVAVAGAVLAGSAGGQKFVDRVFGY